MSPAKGGSYIENIEFGERLAMRLERDTYVFDVEYAAGTEGSITLDSGAVVSRSPQALQNEIPLVPKPTR